MQMGEMNLLKENLVDVERAWRRNDTLAVYEAYRNLAVHFATTNKPKRSVSFFLKCLEMAASCDYYEGELRANLNLGLAYESMQDTQNAIQYHEAHMEMALSSENQVEASKAYSNLIRVYQRFADELEAQGEHELALEQLQLRLMPRRAWGTTSPRASPSSASGSACSAWGARRRCSSASRSTIRDASRWGTRWGRARRCAPSRTLTRTSGAWTRR